MQKSYDMTSDDILT